MKPGDAEAVEQLFNDAAPTYDRLNDWLSFGLHRQWKRQMLLQLSPQRGERWLDLCCGTGDLALALGRRLRPGGQVIGVDAAAAPLAVAAGRSAREPWLPIVWRQGDALALDLPDASADGAVMAYGLRNLSDPAAGLRNCAASCVGMAELACWISTGYQRGRRLPRFSALICAAWWCRLRRVPAWKSTTPTWRPASRASPMDRNRKTCVAGGLPAGPSSARRRWPDGAADREG